LTQIPALENLITKIISQNRVPDSEDVILGVPKAAEKAKKEKLTQAFDVIWTNLKEEERLGKSGREAYTVLTNKIKEKNVVKNINKKKAK
jgi:hypothetical protein